MARPKNADSEQTQMRILRAAASYFAEQGYGGASMRKIAQLARVSQASIHHYFSTKSDLYDACIDEIYKEAKGLEDYFSVMFTAKTFQQKQLIQSICLLYRFAKQRKNTVRMLYRIVIEGGESQIPQRQKLLFQFLDQLTCWLQPHTTLQRIDLRMAIYSFVFLVNRIVLVEEEELKMLVEGDCENLDAEVERFLCNSFLRMTEIKE